MTHRAVIGEGPITRIPPPRRHLGKERMPGSPGVESEGRDILSVEGLSLSFGGLAALADVDFTIRESSITGIIGERLFSSSAC